MNTHRPLWRRLSTGIATIAILATFMVTLQPDERRVEASFEAPPKGSWGFCTTSDEVGCIEKLQLEDANGEMITYTSSATLESHNVELSVTCTAPGSTCEPPPPFTSQSCGTAGTSINALIGPPVLDENNQPVDQETYVDREFTLVLRTGSFNPVFSIGGLINKTSRIEDANGHTYSVTGKMQKTYGLSWSSVPMDPPNTYRERLDEFLRNSIADSQSVSAGVSVYPLANLYSTSISINGECVLVPLQDAFIDTNGMGVSHSLEPAPASSNIMSTISFQVAGPHFLPDSNGADDKFVPARVRMWLPKSYIQAAGFSDTSSFTSNDIRVRTRANENQSITLSTSPSGVMVDFGITHYSAPDPVAVIYKKIQSHESPSTPAVTTPIAPQLLSSKIGKKLSIKKITRFLGLKIKKDSRVVILQTKSSMKVCRVSKSTVVGLRAGNCRLSISITPTKGKKIIRRTVVEIHR